MAAATFTLCIFTDNSPGVLHRITVLFTRRKVNIESLTVSETERPGVSRFTIVVRNDEELVRKIAKQIERIIEVRECFVCEDPDLIFREIAFYKVATRDPAARLALEELAERHSASVIFSSDSAVVLQRAGTEDEIRSLYSMLESYRILEFVRSGRIAVLKQDRSSFEEQEHDRDLEARSSF